METLSSYVCGKWHEASEGFQSLVDPSTGEEIARASSAGVDFAAALAFARETGGPALRALTFAQRADLLKAMARALRDRRDELLELSRINTGTTRPHGAFDVDGATGTLAYYAGLGKRLGDRSHLVEDEGVQLARTEEFWGRHLLVPRRGAAVHVNAFNFPAWGFAEKAACSLLAGMPMITKPATATAMVAHRTVAIVVEAGVLPPGALQLVCGGTGDLLDLLGPQDALAFTGSAETAAYLRDRDNLRRANTRVNVEADSLNAAVLAPGTVAEATRELFFTDVVREMTQKTGQKCTAVRRILVPEDALDQVEAELSRRLAEVVTGNPADESVTMGPLATAQQLEDAERGVAELAREARLVVGSGERIDGVGSPAGRGFFFGPTLLRASSADAGSAIHRREVFGPVATLVPYGGSAEEAAEMVGRAEGTLVTSVYGDDSPWLEAFVAGAGATTGRIYLGTERSAPAAPGSGIALPQTLHGGPGRAGGGEELGGLVGVRFYLQRVALQGARTMVDRIAEGPSAGVE